MGGTAKIGFIFPPTRDPLGPGGGKIFGYSPPTRETLGGNFSYFSPIWGGTLEILGEFSPIFPPIQGENNTKQGILLRKQQFCIAKVQNFRLRRYLRIRSWGWFKIGAPAALNKTLRQLQYSLLNLGGGSKSRCLRRLTNTLRQLQYSLLNLGGGSKSGAPTA